MPKVSGVRETEWYTIPSATGIIKTAFNTAVKIAIRELIEINLGHCGIGRSECMANVMNMAARASVARKKLEISIAQA